MARLKEVLAKNLKTNRKKNGISQAKLAEKADISTHYVAMLELAHNFPTADVLERLAAALDIEVFELFLVCPSTKEEMERLHRTIVADIKKTVDVEIEKAFTKYFTKFFVENEIPNENTYGYNNRSTNHSK